MNRDGMEAMKINIHNVSKRFKAFAALAGKPHADAEHARLHFLIDHE